MPHIAATSVRLVFCCILTLVGVFIHSLRAQIPHTISYQGVLTESNGTFLPDGIYTVELRLYDNTEAEKPIYSERQRVTVIKGLFTILIGSQTPLDDNISFNRAYFLGVSVNGGEEMKPRTALSAVPYALRAEWANHAETAAVSTTALALSSQATGTVRSLNGAEGNLSLKGGEGISVNRSGNDIIISNPSAMQSQNKGNKLQIPTTVYYNGDLNGSVNTNSSTWYVTLAQKGATTGQVMRWNGTAWAPATISTTPSGTAGGALTGSYPNPGIAANTIGTTQLANNAVTDAKVVAGISGAKISGDISGNAANVTGIVTIANGGTGATTVNDARTNLGLGTLATLNVVGTTEIGNGAVTDAKVAAGISGTKISGDISGNAANVTGVVAIANGGTGATTANDARTNLGLGTLATLNVVGTTEISNGAITDAKVTTGISSSKISGDISGSAANVTGVVAIANGGTGATTANAALSALLPSQTGNANKVLSTNGSNASWQDAGGLQYFDESRHDTATNASRPVHTLSVMGADTDIDLALSPKGSGSLSAQVADGDVPGGNKRGLVAVDWQMSRYDPAQVASGAGTVIAGGVSNTASAAFATVGGGINNTASADRSTVSGGQGNIANGEYSVVAGGVANQVSSLFGSILGGATNQLLSGADYSSILGGRGLQLSGNNSMGFLANPTGINGVVVSANSTMFLGNADLWLANTDGSTRSLRFYEQKTTGGGNSYPDGTNYVAFKAANSINADVTWTLPAADGSNGQFLSTNGSGVLQWISPFQLQYISEASHSAAPNDTRPVHSISASGGEADIDLALRPKGNGALIAAVPDGISGNNGAKRGEFAVDWQHHRYVVDEVASGNFTVISGGTRNKASELASTVAGGVWNYATGQYTSIGGGLQNTASAQYASVSGGNSNMASGSSAVVSGGRYNLAQGEGSSITGGEVDTANGRYSAILGGTANRTEGELSAILSGTANRTAVDALYSVVMGGRGLSLESSNSIGSLANANGTRDMTFHLHDAALFGNMDVVLANNNGTVRLLCFYEQYDAAGDFPNGTNFVAFKAPNSINTNVIWTLPAADGSNGQVLTTDGGGTLGWTGLGAVATLNTIGTSELSDNSVTSAKIAAAAVTPAKISSSGASSGNVLTYNGTNVVWAAPASNTASTMETYTLGSGNDFTITVTNTNAVLHRLNFSNGGYTGKSVTINLPNPNNYTVGTQLSFFCSSESFSNTGPTIIIDMVSGSGQVYNINGGGARPMSFGQIMSFSLVTDGTHWYRSR